MSTRTASSLVAAARRTVVEMLESRQLLSAAFDVVQLTNLRADPVYAGVDGSGIGVAVIDTGTFAAHTDLRNNFKAYYDAVKDGPVLTNPDDAGIIDPHGHGSHVAGTATSSNPEIGVATAAGLIGIRGLLADGEAYPRVDPVLRGLRWVLQNYQTYNIKVVNMSLGRYSENINTELPASDESIVIDQLEAVGVTVVTAMGNGYGGFVAPGSSTPGVYSTIQVANTWEDSGTASDRSSIGLDSSGKWGVIDDAPVADQLSASSQRSTLPNSVAAPGTTIYSTWNGEGGQLYNTIRGTSMASPLVAGVVALMQDAAFSFGGRYLSPADVLAVLRATADPIVDSETASTSRIPLTTGPDGNPVQSGPEQNIPETGNTYLRVNAYKAIQRVRDLVTNGGTNPPTDPPPTDPGDRTEDTNHTTTSAVPVPNLDATSNYNVTGNIGVDGQVNVGVDDVDLYKITLDAPGVVSFAFTDTSTLSPYVRLFDVNGAELNFANVGATVTTNQLTAGTYYFGVSSQANSAYDVTTGTGSAGGTTTGAYAFTVGLVNDDPNGVFQGAFEIDLTDANAIDPTTQRAANFITGTIDSDPNPVDPDGARVQIGATDVDMFRLIAPDTGIITIDIDAKGSTAHPVTGVDSYVKVFHLLDNGTVELVDDNDDEQAGVNTDSYLQVDVEEGETYFVAITTFGNRDFDPADPFNRSSDSNETGDYDAYFSFANGDQNGTLFSPANWDDVQSGDTALGTIGADFGTPLLSDATNGGYKDVDFFQYVAAESGLLDVEAISDDMNPTVALWQLNDAGTDVVRIGGDANADARVAIEVTAGDTVYISVTGQGNANFNWFAPASGQGGDVGTYELSAVIRTDDGGGIDNNDSVEDGTPEALALNTSLSRNLGFDGPISVGDADIDIYSMAVAASGNYTFTTSTLAEDSADTVLRVFNSDGDEIAFNDNVDATTTGSLVTVALTVGQTYYIGVSGAGDASRSYDPITGGGVGAGSRGNYVLFASTDAVVADPAPDLTITSVTATKMPTTLVPFDKGTVTVVVLNDGDETFASKAVLNVYLSTDGTLDGTDTLLKSTKSSKWSIKVDKTKTIKVPVAVPADFATGTYFLVASVVPEAGVVEGSSANNTGADATARTVKWQFGDFDGRKKVKLKLTDNLGVAVVFAKSGPGFGTVSIGEDSIFDLSFVDTTTKTTASVKAAARKTSVIDDINITGDFKTFSAKTIELAGEVVTSGIRGKFAFRDETLDPIVG